MSTPINTISAVIVCFHPDSKALAQLIDNIQADVKHILIINNGPLPLVGNWPASVQNVHCSANIGVAGALKLGFDQAYAQGADAVIGFDQDSAPPPKLVHHLSNTLDNWQRQNPADTIAAIGPATRDIDNGHLLHTFAPYNWSRNRIQPRVGKPLVVDHLITSGCLITRDAWQDIGPTDEKLFIDWVDVEWCGRARLSGYRLIMDTDAILPHRIGQNSAHFLGRKFHVHSPFRHYFVMRNAILVWHNKSFPIGWRTHHVLYAIRVILANLIVAPDRISRLRHAVRGLLHGFAGHTGEQGQVPK